jgi:hypothetical protein
MSRWHLAALLIALAAVLPSHVRAEDSATKVTIASVGPKKFRVRVAAGSVIPCESSANTQLFEGPLEPGASVSFTSPQGLVCVQQTYEDFPEVGWNYGFLAWGTCFGWGGKKDGPWCKDGDGAIHVTLRSTPPKK